MGREANRMMFMVKGLKVCWGERRKEKLRKEIRSGTVARGKSRNRNGKAG